MEMSYSRALKYNIQEEIYSFSVKKATYIHTTQRFVFFFFLKRYYSPLNTCGSYGTRINQSECHDDDIHDQSSCRYYDNISIFRDVNKPRVRDSTTLQYSIAH